jgi:GDPmannose 4,6-dehydratase
MNNSILITGITGQVGSQLADYILDNTDLNVIGFMRWQEPLDNLYHLTSKINKKDRIFISYGDLNDYTSIYDSIDTHGPKYISHLAAQSFPKTSFDIPIETLQTNIIGTTNLLESVRKVLSEQYSPSVHICSSSEVYGRQVPGVKLDEQTPFHGSSPYSISKIASDFLGQFYGEAYGIKTFITRMGTHSGSRRSDVFFESTVAKQIALIEAGIQEPKIYVGNLSSTRTFQDTRDAVRAYFLLLEASFNEKITKGDFFNIAGKEAFKLNEVIDILLQMSSRKDIEIVSDDDRFRPIDADYQMFDNTKIKSVINWEPKIPVKDMFEALLNHWREQIKRGSVPLNR